MGPYDSTNHGMSLMQKSICYHIFPSYIMKRMYKLLTTQERYLLISVLWHLLNNLYNGIIPTLMLYERQNIHTQAAILRHQSWKRYITHHICLYLLLAHDPHNLDPNKLASSIYKEHGSSRIMSPSAQKDLTSMEP